MDQKTAGEIQIPLIQHNTHTHTLKTHLMKTCPEARFISAILALNYGMYPVSSAPLHPFSSFIPSIPLFPVMPRYHPGGIGLGLTKLPKCGPGQYILEGPG
ncbi:hypothetical protein CEXT_793331 [Caerostris extrusa]|uniref:Uncharacterized protein n=1 Tax=Caerostris extrusa TaxID=172846 RepID=A0AAV4SU85_CAEEX|nr:hypothetical protein CEXT_793331 [Caerostris extrusa]